MSCHISYTHHSFPVSRSRIARIKIYQNQKTDNPNSEPFDEHIERIEHFWSD